MSAETIIVHFSQLLLCVSSSTRWKAVVMSVMIY